MTTTGFKLLVAYDGSPYSEAAMADLKKAGLPKNTRVEILSLANVFLPSGNKIAKSRPLDWVDESVEKAREEAREAVNKANHLALKAKKRLQAGFPQWTVTARADAASPAWGVIQRADQWKPHLILIGSHGHSAPVRLLLGSVSLKVLTHARGSVRIGRSSSLSSKKPVRLLIGFDGSPDAAEAVRAVTRRSWPKGTLAKVVTVRDLRLVGANNQAWVARMTSSVVARLNQAGLKASSSIQEGVPAQTLLKEAEHWKADCIFVGARGLTAIDRFLLGSVSTTVAARAHCSVEIIRRKK